MGQSANIAGSAQCGAQTQGLGTGFQALLGQVALQLGFGQKQPNRGAVRSPRGRLLQRTQGVSLGQPAPCCEIKGGLGPPESIQTRAHTLPVVGAPDLPFLAGRGVRSCFRRGRGGAGGVLLKPAGPVAVHACQNLPRLADKRVTQGQ